MGRKAIEPVSVTLWMKGRPFSVPAPLSLDDIDVKELIVSQWQK